LKLLVDFPLDRTSSVDVVGIDDVVDRVTRELIMPYLDQISSSSSSSSSSGTRETLSSRLCSGAIVSGPSGTGKTNLCYWMGLQMRHLGVKFMSVSSADIIDKLVGESERRVAKIFEAARSMAPCFLLFDNIDTILGKAATRTSHQALDRVLSSFLIEIDKSANVIVLGTSSSLDDIDKALLRPGRLELHVTLRYPDEEQRSRLIASFVTSMCRTDALSNDDDDDDALAEFDEKVKVVASMTSVPWGSGRTPLSPSDLKNLTKDAAMQLLSAIHSAPSSSSSSYSGVSAVSAVSGVSAVSVCDEVIKSLTRTC